MPQAACDEEPNNARIGLGLFELVEHDGTQPQRKHASNLAIALGLVNASLKRCVKKVLLKIEQARARCYAIKSGAYRDWIKLHYGAAN